MTDQKYIYILISVFLCSIFHVTSADEGCDKSKCKGPLKYYEDMGCTPTYGSEDSCCPVKYNCAHLFGRSIDKCYYKGRTYAIGENLKAEDANPCDIGCHCGVGWNTAAHFNCAIVDCFNRPKPGCYLKKSHEHCCPGPEVCPGDGTEIARCEVDGKAYLDGQEFTPSSDPSLSCICLPGYKGENIAPFCKPVPPFTCNVELRHGDAIYRNCTPTFTNSENPATDCHLSSRCQNEDDIIVVKSEDSTETEVSDPSFKCVFGNMTMNLGDELNMGTYYTSVCVKCLCEIPPIPTCQQLPENECDITVHREFEHFSK